MVQATEMLDLYVDKNISKIPIKVDGLTCEKTKTWRSIMSECIS